MTSGKAKGGSFERAACKDLGRWVTRGERDDIFWRSAMSGGRHTVARKQGRSAHASAGDISAIHPAGAALVGAFIIECKHYRDLKMHSLLVPLTSACIRVFWEIVCTCAADDKKLPMLIGKEHNLPCFVLLDLEGWDRLIPVGVLPVAVYPKVMNGPILIWWDDFLRYAVPI